MAENEKGLSLVIRAVDKLTGPLREMNAKIAKATEPVHRLGHAFKDLGEESGLSRLGEHAHEFGDKVKEAGAQAMELGKRLLELEVVGGFALVEVIKGSVEAGAQLSMMAQRVGLTVDQYAQLQFAAGQAHVQQEEFNGAMDKFSKNLGQAKAGTGSLYEFLMKISPALAYQVRGAKNTAVGLDLMTKAFSKLNDQNKIAALATEAFGKSGAQFGQFLHQGSAAIDAQKKRYFELAGSQEKFAEGSEDAEQALNEASAAFGGLRNGAMAEILPAFTELTKGVAEFVAQNRGGLAKWARETGAAIGEWVKGGGVERLSKSLGAFAQSIGRAVDMIGGLKGVLIGVAAVTAGPFVLSLVQAGAALVPLVGSLAQFGVSLVMMAAGPVVAFVGSIGTFVSALRLGFTAVEAMQLAFAPALLAAAPFVLAAGGIAAAGYEIYKNWGDLKFIAKDTWGSITFYVSQAWDKIKPIFDAVSSVGGSMLFHPMDALKTAGQFYGQALGITGGGSSATAQPTTVKVSFENMPRGTRVATDRTGDQPVDLNLGYAGLLP